MAEESENNGAPEVADSRQTPPAGPAISDEPGLAASVPPADEPDSPDSTASQADQQAVRVPGTNWLGLPGRARLLVNDRELISITDNWFTQERRRFNLKDIRAVVARRLPGWMAFNLFLMFVVIVMGLVGVDMENYWILAVAGLFLAVFFLNILPGPTCSCYVWTAVTTASLPAVGRIAGFRKMIRALRPGIETVQGVLTDEDIAAATAGEPAGAGVSVYRRPRCRMGFHYLAYLAMFTQSSLGFALIGNNRIDAIVTLGLIQFLFISVALSRQTSTDAGPVLIALTWLSLLWTCAGPITMLWETNWINFIGTCLLAIAGLLACYAYTTSESK
ncbi:MAG: hypothetical protein HZA50_11075 [Planctomycetes bacterium]|nr:hypothetical protein [Planctomycetota bacterium]